MSLWGALRGRGPSGFGYGSTAEDVTDGIGLAGKTFAITGCNSGIGKETMRVLAMRGARILAIARTADKARATAANLGIDVVPFACDLSEPHSVQSAVRAILDTGIAIDGLIANAGVMAIPKRTVKHGLELHFLTNHMGHFILVTGLIDALADRARVVILSSDAHRFAPPLAGIELGNLDAHKGLYNPWLAYGQSKLANLLFARQLAVHLEGSGKTANAVHPGLIHTNLMRHTSRVIDTAITVGRPLVVKSIPEGAATQCYVATHPSLDGVNGEYFANCNRARSSRKGRDMTLARRLWDKSEELRAQLLAERS